MHTSPPPRRVVWLLDGEIDLSIGIVRRRERTAQLTDQEVRLMLYLDARQGQDVTRAELMGQVLGYDLDSSSRAIDLAIRRLRTKIEVDPSEPRHLVTVYTVGYRLVAAATRAVITRTNVPPHRDRILGREELLATLLARLDDPDAGPWVLVGPAGVGKSRVATELIRHAAESCCPAGAFRLDLAADDGDVIVALAAAAKLPSHAGSLASLAKALAMRGPTLVVLDDIDHAAERAVQVMEGLHSAGVRVVATCRRSVPQAEGVRVEPLTTEVATELFVARAHQARSGWRPTVDDDRAVADIVSATDALPLALELAATRVRAMSTTTIAAEVRRSLRVLRTAGSGRHGSMSAAIAWTWSSLGPHSRSALAQLTVFGGSASRSAVLDVVDVPEVGAVLDDLLERSLIRLEEDRIVQFHAVREYARHQVPEAMVGAGKRHVRWAAEHARRWTSLLRGPRCYEALDALATDEANLRAALVGALDLDDAEAASWCLIGLDTQDQRSWVAERAANADQIVALTPHPSIPLARVQLLRFWFQAYRGRWDQALPLAIQIVEDAQQLNDPWTLVDAHRSLCTALTSTGDHAKAERAARRAIELAAGDAACLTRAWLTLGGLQMHRGRTDGTVIEILERAAAIADEAGDHAVRAAPLINLGSVLALSGDRDGAMAAWDRAEAACHPDHGLASLSMVALNRGWAYLIEDSWELAIAELQRSADVSLQAGFIERRAWALCITSTAMARTEGPSADALELARRSADQLDELSALRRWVARAIYGAILALAGRPHAAATEFRHAQPGLAVGLDVDADRAEQVIGAFLSPGGRASALEWLSHRTGPGHESCVLLAILLRGHTC